MATFLLRHINPELWAKVQTKAVAEGLTPKALILKAIAQYVGLIVLALVTVACQTPNGPSAQQPIYPPYTPPPPYSTQPPVQPVTAMTVDGSNIASAAMTVDVP